MRKKIYVIGDSHAVQLSRTDRRIGGTGVMFHPFGAVKQSINPHHKLGAGGKSIDLLEQNWQVRSLPISDADLFDQETIYYISLPFNVFPLLRTTDTTKFTIDPTDRKRDFLSVTAQRALFARRNKLALAMVSDMAKIGLNVVVIENARPFVGADQTQADNDMLLNLSSRYYDWTNSLLERENVRVLHQPQHTREGMHQTAAKFLDENDPSKQHGNGSYYEIVLSSILEDAGVSAVPNAETVVHAS